MVPVKLMNACALVIDSSPCVQAEKLYKKNPKLMKKAVCCIYIKESQDSEEETENSDITIN